VVKHKVSKGMTRNGLLIVLSGPSGAGKGTVCRALRSYMPDIKYSVSVTTRPPRSDEAEGVNYFFTTRSAFQDMIRSGKLLEWAEVYGNYYGTPKEYVEQMLSQGHDVLLEIDTQGAMLVKKKFPDGVFIFLIPPSLQELKARIIARGSETDESLQIRFSAAAREMSYVREYHYVVVNDKVENACEVIASIIRAEHCSVKRYKDYFEHLIQEGM
jgi:guanylate kinase